ncbi:hypothetical protein BOTBODRAFT_171966 [Botryobasidium botryosum FD-172 SS1]|uniref:Uncharacterized protein n=1 Tax=Botryobasidium botryosum (strain FD-172 SS1) TaxID=930990 RepID=A0A067MPL1_BOTB1|nr:hypothetical protein BOTBODRAFT_171966 [Botryobasidium botryosum FD-172 SS1]
MATATAAASNRPSSSNPLDASHNSISFRKLNFTTLGRVGLGVGRRTVSSSRDLEIFEATDELLALPISSSILDNGEDISLLRGFNATIPSSEKGKIRRRRMRNIDFDLGSEGRGEAGQLVKTATFAAGMKGKGKGARKKSRESLGKSVRLGRDELARQRNEILLDKENLHVRRTLIHSEISEIARKIAALDAVRERLEGDLMKLQEDELELDDELEGVEERFTYEEFNTSRPSSVSTSTLSSRSSRRRKGPAFLPSEHDSIPPGVAFMTLSSHTASISALDFSEPYGLLVSAGSAEDSSTRVWDLREGEEIGRLIGHAGSVKCIQVEEHFCMTGGTDSNLRLWDLRLVAENEVESKKLDVIHEPKEEGGENTKANGPTIRQGGDEPQELKGPCVKLLEGHSKAVTALYFEEECLVTGASDKTIRQWDLNTGQCVQTMDILWAISHPPRPMSPQPRSSFMFTPSDTYTGTFAVPTPPYSDGSWDMYQDFVGGVQFWGYALVSGSGDGAVRMWDMRTGQAHRTLLGHTAPVTCLQFDEHHIISGSLDKSIRIWDLRMGNNSETLRYDHPVTSLQFDTRKIIACAGENGVKIYNRTTMQHSALTTNGHDQPAERLRYMDRYLVTGGRDATVKVWAL